MEQLREIYQKYAQEIAAVKEKEPPMAGLFNLGGSKNHPSHTIFYDHVEKWVDAFAASGPDAEQTEEAVRWILSAAWEHPKEPCYWFYFVAQNHAKKLIPMLPPEKRKELAVWYDRAYPVKDRLPAHREIYALLAGNEEKPKKKWKFGF